MTVVVDASVVVELLLQTSRGRLANDRLRSFGRPYRAPHLIDLEVMHVMRRLAAAGVLPSADVRVLMGVLARLPIVRHAHGPLVSRIWDLRLTVTAYDAAYVALAGTLGATLLTGDARLARAPGVQAVIEVV